MAQAHEAQPAESRQRLKMRKLSTIPTRSIEWLWYPYIPRGKITIFEGWQGVGKSFVTCDLTSRITTGRPMPDQFEDSEKPGDVIIFSSEDDAGDTIRPRIEQLGGNVDRCVVEHVDLDNSTGSLVLDDFGFEDLNDIVRELQPKLVIFDPLFAYTSAKTDIYRPNESRAIMSKLFHIARQHHTAIMCIRHLRKSGGRKETAGLGSVDFSAAVRSILMAGYEPGNEGNRAVVHTKCNVAALGPSLGYVVDADGFRWTGPSELGADEILGSSNGGQGPKTEEAAEFLIELLELEPEGVPVKKIMAEAERRGIKRSALERAKTAFKIVSRKVGLDNGWVWTFDDVTF